MNEALLRKMRAEATEIFNNALSAVDPYKAVERFLALEGEKLTVGPPGERTVELDLSRFARISLVGGGKATAPMARALEDLFGTRLQRGFINVKDGFVEPLKVAEIVEAGHPLPDQRGVAGTKKIQDWLESLGEKDLVFALISGGGSALLPLPAGEVGLTEKQELTGRLLACGASIDEINAVRKHISRCKGGQLARSAYPATVVDLLVSDVVGDRLDVIASGPFAPDPTTYADVDDILQRYDLRDIPPLIKTHLAAGRQKKIPETPKQGAPEFERVSYHIVASNILALEAAAKSARNLGYETVILSSMVEGETRDVARVHGAIGKEIVQSGYPAASPACLISGGETTVTIRGSGLGGRNQEFCLAVALDLEGYAPRMVVLSGGTDGNDGPTDAAGGIVDPLTIRRGAEQGMRGRDFLQQNDSYHFLQQTGDLLLTGQTNTNVMDVRIVLVR